MSQLILFVLADSSCLPSEKSKHYKIKKNLAHSRIRTHDLSSRTCSSYECFILRAVWIFNKLLGLGYVKERLKSYLRTFYVQYGDLTKQYEVPLSWMLQGILDDDHIQWHPPLIRHYTNFYRYWSGPYYRIQLFT